MKAQEARPQKGMKKAQAGPAGRPQAQQGYADYPAAGPHAKPHLTDPEKTPGTGALPDVGRPRDADATG